MPKKEQTSSDNNFASVTSSGSGLNKLIPKSFKPGNVIFPGNSKNDTYVSPNKQIEVGNAEEDSSFECKELTPIIDQSKSASALDVSRNNSKSYNNIYGYQNRSGRNHSIHNSKR